MNNKKTSRDNQMAIPTCFFIIASFLKAAYNRYLLLFGFLLINDRMIRRTIVTILTHVPIKLSALNKNPMKMMLNDRSAKIVVKGNHFTLNAGLLLYCGLNFNWAAQILIQIIMTVKPGMVMR